MQYMKYQYESSLLSGKTCFELTAITESDLFEN